MSNLYHEILTTIIQDNPTGFYNGIAWQHLHNGMIKVFYKLDDSTESITVYTAKEAANEILYKTQYQP